MKKMTILLITVLFMVIGYAAYNATINIYGNALLAENISDFKVYLSNLKVNGTEVSGINETKDEFTINDINGDISVDIVNDSTEYDTEAYLECGVENTWDFDYTGGEQTFTAPIAGTYKLEVWGAQGYTINSYIGGYGGYSTGKITFSKNQKIYLFVGEKGNGGVANNTTYSSYPNSLNATAGDNVSYIGSGGGSTHITLENSLISQITNLDKLIIVSGGGGASTWTSGDGWSGTGGSGGGFKGNSGKSNIANFLPGGGGTQTSEGNAGNDGTAGNFGLSELTKASGSCGGGGYYGGGTSWGSAGGGGSGYIGNSLLSEKTMYCYNCEESSEENTKTISTTCTSETPKENCAKSGNGYAKITLIQQL